MWHAEGGVDMWLDAAWGIDVNMLLLPGLWNGCDMLK